MASSSVHTGLRDESRTNSRLTMRYNGLRIMNFTASGAAVENGTFTAGSGMTASSGNIIATTGDIRATAGNYRGGPVNAFATTEPTQSVVLEAGTAPAGAITTSSGIFSSATVLRKIIADGTASNVET